VNAIGYLRVSGPSQIDAYGFEDQERAVRTYAEVAGLTLVDVFREEAVSGTMAATDRPAFGAALAALDNGEAEAIVIPSLSRLARTLEVQEAALEAVWRREARVFAADQGEVPRDDPEDPTRMLLRRVLGLVHEYDRAALTARLRRGRRLAKEAGHYIGGSAPFGWRIEPGNGLVKDEREQRVLKAMRAWREEGRTFESIATGMNLGIAGGIPLHPRRGPAWTKQAVHRVLRRSP
jgi:DNA invertase Pin-like site-specific DNA recombinase